MRLRSSGAASIPLATVALPSNLRQPGDTFPASEQERESDEGWIARGEVGGGEFVGQIAGPTCFTEIPITGQKS